MQVVQNQLAEPANKGLYNQPIGLPISELWFSKAASSAAVIPEDYV